MGDDRGAAVPAALQKGPTHQKVHQDCSTVSRSHSDVHVHDHMYAHELHFAVLFEIIKFKWVSYTI